MFANILKISVKRLVISSVYYDVLLNIVWFILSDEIRIAKDITSIFWSFCSKAFSKRSHLLRHSMVKPIIQIYLNTS